MNSFEPAMIEPTGAPRPFEKHLTNSSRSTRRVRKEKMTRRNENTNCIDRDLHRNAIDIPRDARRRNAEADGSVTDSGTVEVDF